MTEKESEAMLSSCKVLDLCDEKGALCGRILSDLGAEVIAVEPPQGNPARRLGPFYHDTPDLESSLFWLGFGLGKKSITLNLDTAEGRGIFKRLAKSADIVLESFPPGGMDKLGIGFAALHDINPKLVVTSVAPFGGTGPYRDFKATDFVVTAIAGLNYIAGEPEREPLRVPVPQSYLFGGSWAAAGSLIALYHRDATGEGQHVDVSCLEASVQANFIAPERWSYAGSILKRAGTWREVGPAQRMRLIYPCRDGYVLLFIEGGAHPTPGQNLLLEWMDMERMCPDWLRGFDFSRLDVAKVSQDFWDRLSEAIGPFFANKTKTELFEWANENRLFLAPVSNARDMLDSPQLAARDFWVQLPHPELGTSITYPGAFALFSETPVALKRRAPHIGEHNEEIYGREFGWSEEKLAMLRQSGVI